MTSPQAVVAADTGAQKTCPCSYPKMSSLLRFYVYGIHGYVIEVMFTATWDFVVNVNWKFPGYTSVWSFFIYAISGFVIERMYLQLKDRTHILLRGLIYLLWSYAWEFSTGYLLSKFNCCPWDYTPFDFNVVGLITLEYAPLWFIATLVHEQVITKCALSLCWGPDIDHDTTHTPGPQQLGTCENTSNCRSLDKDHSPSPNSSCNGPRFLPHHPVTHRENAMPKDKSN